MFDQKVAAGKKITGAVTKNMVVIIVAMTPATSMPVSVKKTPVFMEAVLSPRALETMIATAKSAQCLFCRS